MSLTSSRRTFLGSGLGSAALLAVQPGYGSPAGKRSEVHLGICSYSFGRCKLSEAIQSAKALNARYINIKPEFQIPYTSTAAELAEAKKMLDDAGLQLVGTGTAYLQKNDEAEIRRCFEYNRALGSSLIVNGPTRETLPLIEKFAKEFNIKIAIHNHGTEDKHFPTPQSVLSAIKGMDPHIGLCIDIGHTLRTGTDPAAAAKEAGARLLDVHLKDIRKAPDGKWVGRDCGEGEVPLTAVLRQLEGMGFNGHCNLEYEVRFAPDGHELTAGEKMVGMQKSLAYLRGIAAGLKAA